MEMLSMQVHSVFVVLAVLWFGFVVYKKGGEFHWLENTLFDISIVSAASAFLVSRLIFVLENLQTFSANWLRIIMLVDYPGYSFWGLVLGLIGGAVLFSKKGEVKLYEALDVMVLAFFGAVPIERVGVVLHGGNLNHFLLVPVAIWQGLICLVAFVFLWHLEYEYRTFDWYRNKRTQAKAGFISGLGLILMPTWLGLSMIGGKINLPMIISLVISIICGLLVIYSRSGRRLFNPIKLLKRGSMV